MSEFLTAPYTREKLDFIANSRCNRKIVFGIYKILTLINIHIIRINNSGCT